MGIQRKKVNKSKRRKASGREDQQIGVRIHYKGQTRERNQNQYLGQFYIDKPS